MVLEIGHRYHDRGLGIIGNTIGMQCPNSCVGTSKFQSYLQSALDPKTTLYELYSKLLHRGGYLGDYIGDYYGDIKGDTRSLD